MKAFVHWIFVVVLVSSIFPRSASASELKLDDIAGHWAEKAIQWSVDNKIVLGYEDGSFKPDNEVTRAEFMAMVVTALNFPTSKKSVDSNWSDPYVLALANAGIYRYTDFTVGDLGTPISRFEISQLAVRALSEGRSIQDQEIMYLAVQMGLITGNVDGMLDKEAVVTRAQAVSVIERIALRKSGKVLPVDKRALSYAEVEMSGTNIRTMFGDPYTAKPLPYAFNLSRPDLNSYPNLKLSTDQLLIIDMTDPQGAYRQWLTTINASDLIKQMPLYVVAMHINVDATDVQPGEYYNDRISVWDYLSFGGYTVGVPKEVAEQTMFKPIPSLNLKNAIQAEGWIFGSLFKEDIDQKIQFGETNFSIRFGNLNSTPTNWLTNFHEKKAATKPLKLSEFIKARFTGIPYATTTTFPSDVKAIMQLDVDDVEMIEYGVGGRSLETDFFKKYDNYLSYTYKKEETVTITKSLFFKNVPGMAENDRIQLIDRMFQHDKRVINELNLLFDLSQPSSTLDFEAQGDGAYTMISAGDNHSLLVRKDGAVHSFGQGGFQQLGKQNSDRIIEGLDRIVAVSAGGDHSLALNEEGTVFSWGKNFNGQLGLGTDNRSESEPAQVPGLPVIKSISAGGEHSVALAMDGTVWAWGENTFGQVGNGKRGNGAKEISPLQVQGIDNVIAVQAGPKHTLALKQDGSVWGWGSNWNGQMGKSDGDPLVPKLFAEAKGVKRINISKDYNKDITLLIYPDGAAGVCCSNTFMKTKEAPYGEVIRKLEPLTGLPKLSKLARGIEFSLALTENGDVYSWGSNGFGQLGDGSNITREEPLQVKGLKDIVDISVGKEHAIAIDHKGNVWAWGNLKEIIGGSIVATPKLME